MSLSEFIQREANRHGYNARSSIDIEFSYARKRYRTEKDRPFDGCVYGFAVRLIERERFSLFDAAAQKGQVRLGAIDEWVPLWDNVYPLYWGKEWESGSRFRAHLNGHKRNGSLCLYEQDYAALEGKTMLYASVRVSSHVQLEAHLRSCYPNLLKTVIGRGH